MDDLGEKNTYFCFNTHMSIASSLNLVSQFVNWGHTTSTTGKELLGLCLRGWVGILWQEKIDTLGLAQSNSNSDHHKYHVFRLGDPNLNLHLPLESWEGATRNWYLTWKLTVLPFWKWAKSQKEFFIFQPSIVRGELFIFEGPRVHYVNQKKPP